MKYTIQEQAEKLIELEKRVLRATDVTLPQLVSRIRSNKIVAVRAYITHEAIKQGIDYRLVAKRYSRSPGSMFHYINRFKPTFEYETLKADMNQFD